jgi:hypothetical protein
MRRRLLNLATALSLLLSVAACGLWARSLLVGDALTWWGRSTHDGGATAQNRAWFVGAGGGWLAAGRQSIRGPAGEFGAVPSSGWEQDNPDPLRLPGYIPGRRLAVIEWGRHRQTLGAIRYDMAAVATPAWVVAALAGALPLSRARVIIGAAAGRWRRWREARSRRLAGLCRRCGYDLRAAPGRCPECGSAIETA